MLSKSSDAIDNYLAKIIKIKLLRKHSNADRLQIVTIDGFNVITGMSAKVDDLYCFFPLESCISASFLSYTNSFREQNQNKDPLKTGYFENHCRVRCTTFRNERSEGYIIPVSEVERYIKYKFGKTFKFTEFHVNMEFDTINSEQFCKKYVVLAKTPQNASSNLARKFKSKLIENQFNFHKATAQLKKHIENIFPNDYISITEKYHGTSFVVANVLIKNNLSIIEKVLKKLKFNIVDNQYGMLYSSRSVLKNHKIDIFQSDGFYKVDVWKLVADKLFNSLKKGYTAYGEIVGYLPSGKFIQKSYDYSCEPGTFDFLVYRLTFTNPDGHVFELSHQQIKEYCERFGIKTPYEHYYGKAKDLFPEVLVDENWQTNFLKNLIDAYLEKDCKYCTSVPNTPAEGVVLRVDKPNLWEAYKLKSFRFLEYETKAMDNNEVDIESMGDDGEPYNTEEI